MDNRNVFAALTLIVIVVIILLTRDLTLAVAAIAAVAGYLLATRGGGPEEPEEPEEPREGLASFPEPGREAPHPAYVPALPGPAPSLGGERGTTGFPGPYKGAVDFGEYETAPELGHVDRTGDPYAVMAGQGADYGPDWFPYGNPYDTDRIAGVLAAGPCVDDEAVAVFDADELNTYQVRSRNDPYRLAAGALRYKEQLAQYTSSELDEEQDSRWWGRHEV